MQNSFALARKPAHDAIAAHVNAYLQYARITICPTPAALYPRPLLQYPATIHPGAIRARDNLQAIARRIARARGISLPCAAKLARRGYTA